MTFHVSQQDQKTLQYCNSYFSNSRNKDQEKWDGYQYKAKIEVLYKASSGFKYPFLIVNVKI